MHLSHGHGGHGGHGTSLFVIQILRALEQQPACFGEHGVIALHLERFGLAGALSIDAPRSLGASIARFSYWFSAHVLGYLCRGFKRCATGSSLADEILNFHIDLYVAYGL